MTVNNTLQTPLLQRNDRGYGTTVITIPPETPKNKFRNLLQVKQLILEIAAFLPGDVYGQFEKVYNDFWQRRISRFEKIGFGIRIALPGFYENAYTQFTYNKLTPEDRSVRAKAIGDSHPTKQALNDFHIIDTQCRKIFEREDAACLPEEKLFSLIGKTAPHGGEYKAQADLYATLMLQHLRKIIPSKSLVEFTSSETEPSDRLDKMLNSFLFYLNEAQTFANDQQSIKKTLKSLPTDIENFECMPTHPLLKDAAMQNLATCLALIIQIKRNVSGLQDRHIADLKTVSDTLIATGFPALALEILNPLALFEDPQHITLSSFKNIFDQWSEASLAYLKKYPDEENIEPMFARLNEMGKQVLTYGYPTNSSLINNTTTHLCQIMQEIHTLSEHKKLLSGNEAKILTGRLQKLNSFGRLNRFDLMQFSLKARLIIFAIGTIIWWGSIALAIWGGANLANYYNLNIPVSIFLSSIAPIFMLAAPFLIHHRYFSIKHRLVTQLTTTW